MADNKIRKDQIEDGENILFSGSISTDDIAEGTNEFHTTERAQDAIGSIVDSTLSYNDTTPAIGRAAITGDITISAGSNTSAIGSGVIVNADINGSAAIDASKIADGTVSSTEFQYINSLTSNAQTQLTAKVNNTGNETIAGVKTFSSIPVLPSSDPTTANQAARKSYVDAIGAMVDPSLYKNSCEVATTANITLSGEQTIDTFATSATRVLVWNQTAPAENGIYISNSGAWTRASDYNTSGEVVQGTSTFIVDGSVNKNRLFVMNAASITTIGTDAITFTPLSSPTEYIAGDGVDITGNTISVIGGGDLVTHTGTLVDNHIPIFNSTSGVIDDSSFSVEAGSGGVTGYTGLGLEDVKTYYKNYVDGADYDYSINSSIVSTDIRAINATSLVSIAGNGSPYSLTQLGTSAGVFQCDTSTVSIYTDIDNYSSTQSNIVGVTDEGELTDGYKKSIYASNESGTQTFSVFEEIIGDYYSFKASPTYNAYFSKLSTENLTANRIFTYPDISGTIAVEATPVTLSDGATVALDAGTGETFLLTASGSRTILAPSNPVSGKSIKIAHTASGGARTLSLTTGAGGFRFGSDITALSATVSGKTDYIGAIYNATDDRWDVVSYAKGY